MKQESRIPPSTWSQTTRTWSLLHSVHDHGPLRYGLKIGQVNILEVPQGKLRNIPQKSSKWTLWGPGSEETNSLVLYEHQLPTQSKDHQWRHIQKSPDNIFSENDENREFVPQSSSTLTADISRTKTNFSKIPSKPFSGLQNLAIEVNLSRRFSWPLKSNLNKTKWLVYVVYRTVQNISPLKIHPPKSSLVWKDSLKTPCHTTNTSWQQNKILESVTKLSGPKTKVWWPTNSTRMP